MTSDPQVLVQRLWDFCDVLRDDGLSYGDYLEQAHLPAVPQDGRRGSIDCSVTGLSYPRVSDGLHC